MFIHMYIKYIYYTWAKIILPLSATHISQKVGHVWFTIYPFP